MVIDEHPSIAEKARSHKPICNFNIFGDDTQNIAIDDSDSETPSEQRDYVSFSSKSVALKKGETRRLDSLTILRSIQQEKMEKHINFVIEKGNKSAGVRPRCNVVSIKDLEDLDDSDSNSDESVD